jgi:glycyl-tRNA synthetase
LCKADLAAQMVIEMTSLQGIMGRYYALNQGESAAVADAILEHWLPRSAGDSLPVTMPGIVLALTDRLDSLGGLFAAGLAPTASADPFALRRAALGVVQILLAHSLDLDLYDAVEETASAQPIPVSEDVQNEIVEFIIGRLDVLLHEQNWPHDVIAAVLAEQGYNPAHALQGITELLDNYARCVRITRAEPDVYNVDPGLFEADIEHELLHAYNTAAEQLDINTNVDTFLTAFTPIVPVIQRYFEGVMVHADDLAIRQNRLGLLQAVAALAHGRADLSELAGF